MVVERDEVFIKVERYVAVVRGKVEESRYSIVLEGVSRLILTDLPKERYGKIDSAFTHVTYRDGDLVKDLLPSEDLVGGEKILVHLAYRSDAIVRWQVLPKED